MCKILGESCLSLGCRRDQEPSSGDSDAHPAVRSERRRIFRADKVGGTCLACWLNRTLSSTCSYEAARSHAECKGERAQLRAHMLHTVSAWVGETSRSSHCRLLRVLALAWGPLGETERSEYGSIGRQGHGQGYRGLRSCWVRG